MFVILHETMRVRSIRCDCSETGNGERGRGRVVRIKGMGGNEEREELLVCDIHIPGRRMKSHALMTTLTWTGRQKKGRRGRYWVGGVGTKPPPPQCLLSVLFAIMVLVPLWMSVWTSVSVVRGGKPTSYTQTCTDKNVYSAKSLHPWQLDPKAKF